jgi:predicted GIY-YIG superfamily endonuclease
MLFPRKRESSRRNSVMQAGERYAVYIMASRRNGTLYVGVTNNLAVRAHHHRTGQGSEFTRKYGVTRLVWYEFHSDINEAINKREAHQEMGAAVEIGAHRKLQCRMGRLV